MAILKHISSKNANYNQSINYLTCKHNEQTNAPILDMDGRMIPRDEFYLDGINCNPYNFAIECKQLNKEWNKNQNKKDVKSHHYIISFDPKDRECGLTPEKAQAIGMEFAKEHFDGHQCLVCTHTDGHNESGNIHVHIVLNSLRKYDVERKPWMERKCDSQAGHKHHLTDECLVAFKKDLMAICEREHLNQVDLTKPAEVKVTDKEYRAKQRGQRIAERKNTENGNTEPIIYMTHKDYIRMAIDDLASTSVTPYEFYKGLESKYGIKTKETRGRFSYLHPERQRYIADRSLGTHYEHDRLLEIFRENSEKTEKERQQQQMFQQQVQEDERKKRQQELAWNIATEKQREAEHHRPHEYDRTYDYVKDPTATIYISTELELVHELQGVIKTMDDPEAETEQQVQLQNMKRVARTLCYIQEHNYNSLGETATRYKVVQNKIQQLEQASPVNEKIEKINEKLHYIGVYQSHWKQYKEEFLSLPPKNRGIYKKGHPEIGEYEEARNYLRSVLGLKKSDRMPNLNDLKKELRTERKQLFDERKEEQRDNYEYQSYKAEERNLKISLDNLTYFLTTSGGGVSETRENKSPEVEIHVQRDSTQRGKDRSDDDQHRSDRNER